MASIPTYTSLTGSNSNQNYSPTFGIRAQVMDTTNPNYVRSVQLNQNSVTVSRGANMVQFDLSALTAAAAALVPALTWPPVITQQPVSQTLAYGQAGGFPMAASAEIAISYQWWYSNGPNAPFNFLTAAGVYSNTNTNTVNISSVTGLSGYQFLCIATDNSGSTNTSTATLTVQNPGFSTQPANTTVMHPAATSFVAIPAGSASITLQWQMANGPTAVFANIAATGVFSNVTNNTLNISDSTGLNQFQFQCVATMGSNTQNSNIAILTVN